MQFFSPLVYAWAFVTNSEQYLPFIWLSFFFVYWFHHNISQGHHKVLICVSFGLWFCYKFIKDQSRMMKKAQVWIEIYGFWLIWGLSSTSSHFTMQILNLRDFFLKWKETHKETFWHDEYHLSHIDEARADNCLNKHLSQSAVKFIIIDGCLKLMDIFKTN